MDVIDIITYRGYKIQIVSDYDNAENPREWDNLGTMLCVHSRYSLGDEHFYSSQELWEHIAWEHNIFDVDGNYETDRERIEKWLFANCIVLPLYIYDHGGVTMRTVPFSCPWDSGQVGFIYITKEQACKEFGWKRISAKRKQQIIDYLRAEVDTYDSYLKGEVYGFVIEEIDESCWNFFGHYENSGLIDHAKDIIKCAIQEHRQPLSISSC